MDEISVHGISTKVGCANHQHQLTKYIVKFYLNTRMIFACRKHNEIVSNKKKNRKTIKKNFKNYLILNSNKI